MSFRVVGTKQFYKSVKKLPKSMQNRIKEKLRVLSIDPMYPSLRAKGIKGHPGIFECSVNMDIRILWRYEGDKIILALDVGHHDILKNLKRY